MSEAGFRVIYVCSASHAGSTLTDMFLGGHSQAASLGEVNFLGKDLSIDAQCSCGAQLRECSAWAKVYAHIASTYGIDMPSRPYGFRLWDALAVRHIDRKRQTRCFRAAVMSHKAWMEVRDRLQASLQVCVPLPGALQEALRNKMAIYQAASETWGKRVLVDSSKNQREAIELYRLWPDRVRIVLLTRDGRGVFLSNRKRGVDRKASLQGWKNYYRRALPALTTRVEPRSLYRLRYEDLAGDPERVGRELCSFAGLDFEPEMLDLSSAARHQINGNVTRFAPGKGIRLDEYWRTELRGEDLAYFNRHGADMNRRLGYE
jgi:hypothetical protein